MFMKRSSKKLALSVIAIAALGFVVAACSKENTTQVVAAKGTPTIAVVNMQEVVDVIRNKVAMAYGSQAQELEAKMNQVHTNFQKSYQLNKDGKLTKGQLADEEKAARTQLQELQQQSMEISKEAAALGKKLDAQVRATAASSDYSVVLVEPVLLAPVKEPVVDLTRDIVAALDKASPTAPVTAEVPAAAPAPAAAAPAKN
jgi:Skp family chaperone for outer membrane proteins